MNDDSQRVDEALGRIKNMLTNNGLSTEEMHEVVEGLMGFIEELEQEQRDYKERMN